MSDPLIAVILYTYSPAGDPGASRAQYASATLRALFTKLRTDAHDLWLHVADDGSTPEYREQMWDLAGHYCGDRRTITNSERRGYGGSYNSASHVVHQLAGVEAILQMEDDWILERPLDLDPLVTALHADPRMGCIRMGALGYFHPLRAEFLWVNGAHYLLFDPTSPSQYIFSGGPRLETVAWARSVGPWPEMMPAGETELAICGRPAARQGVAWPVDLVKPVGDLFSHIGTVGVKNSPLGQAAMA